MPRNVRNFWIDLSVDGRSERVETGPRAKDGGFSLAVLMRDDGDIIRALTVRGFVDSDGSLRLQAYVPREAESHKMVNDIDPGDILVKTTR